MSYDTSIGRFLEEDPEGYNEDGMDLYQMERSNPVRYVDPMGTDTSNTTQTDQSESARNPGFEAGMTAGPEAAWYAYLIKQEAEDFGRRAAAQLGKECPDVSEDDYENAARHLYWQMLIANRYGQDAARYIGNAHENGDIGRGFGPDSERDTANNNVARGIAGKLGPYPEEPYPGDPFGVDNYQREVDAYRKKAEQTALNAIRAGKAYGINGQHLKMCSKCPAK